jgi:hypothetical protein
MLMVLSASVELKIENEKRLMRIKKVVDMNDMPTMPFLPLVVIRISIQSYYPISFYNTHIKEDDDGCICYNIKSENCKNGIKCLKQFFCYCIVDDRIILLL